MAENLSKCKVGILPYEAYDSCPRALPEMLACGLPVVTLKQTRFWEEKYKYVYKASKDTFWTMVRAAMKISDPDEITEYYRNNLSMNVAVEQLKKLIHRMI
jgi:hypothetical protein